MARRLALAAGATLLASVGAQAQFAMPGAVAPPTLAPANPPPAAEPAAPTRRQERARRRAGGGGGQGAEAAIIERTLSLNGSQSRLELERRDGKLVAGKLQLVGVASDGSGKACRVDLAAAGPIEAKDLGKETGLTRYELPAPDCAMSFSALNGAVLMKGPGQVCVFAKEACRSDVTGMWGPPAASLARSARDIEKARGHAENQVRAHYKTLIGRAGGHDAVKVVAREQAGFTSEREMACGGYDSEVQHGFCHARFTEARAAELASRLGGSAKAEAEQPRREKRRAKRHETKPAASEASTPALF